MKREEAIEVLENGGWWDLLIPVTTVEGENEYSKLHEAIDLALSALTPPTQEQMERVWRSTWTMIGADKRGRGGIFKCIKCERCYPVKCDFCPKCGRAMTPKAWEELRKRWEGLLENRAD